MPSHRVQHIPVGSYVNESERSACERLKNRLQGVQGTGLWIFLSNIPFSFQNEGYSDEIDLLVIGPTGVYVIEIKHWDLTYLKNNQNIAELEAEKLNNKAKKVAGKLRNKFDVGFVEGRILLTRGSSSLIEEGKNRKIIRGVSFYGTSDWQEILNVPAEEKLDEQTVLSICRFLEPNTKFALSGDLRFFANLKNLEPISDPHDRYHRIFKGQHITRRDRVILHLYDLSVQSEKNALESAQREYDTVQLLQKSPYLPRILDSFQDVPEYPGELFFYSIIDPLAPSLEERSKDLNWSLLDKYQTVVTLANALNNLHSPSDPDDPAIIHRKLSPRNIRLKSNGQPIFTELQLTKISEAASISNYPALKFMFDAHTAPEIVNGGLAAADKSADVYSLCSSLKILFESIPESKGEIALAILHRGMTVEQKERIDLPTLAKEFEEVADQIEKNEEVSEVIVPAEFWDEDTVISFQNSFYRIVNRLGSGGVGTTFKVIEVNKDNTSEFGTYVAKVIFDHENGDDAIQAYRKVRAQSSHPHLSVIHEIAPKWERDGFVSLMKWIEGIPLSDFSGVLSIYAEDIGEATGEDLLLRWLDDLCDALSSLHRVGLVHGDVTPKNIIVSGGDVFLTDYDAITESGSSPRIQNPLYCTENVQNYQYIDFSDDMYALASSFFQVIFDKDPFLIKGERNKSNGLSWEDIIKSEWPKLSIFVDKATHPDRNHRFSSAWEARSFLAHLKSVETIADDVAKTIDFAVESEDYKGRLTPNEIPRLLDVLRSYPGSLKGNDETRGLDSDFAEQTYVETSLDRVLLKDIVDNKISLMILFGNAGDGKTAFLQQLASNLGIGKLHSSKRIWELQMPSGIKVMANLDGSAAYQGRSATELLDELFAPFQGGESPKDSIHLLAINSGPLQAWLLDYEQRHGMTPLIEQLQSALDGDLSLLHPRFRLIDLNNRSLVGGYRQDTQYFSTEFLDNLLDRFIGDEETDYWQPCQTCSAAVRCSTWESIECLRDVARGKHIRQRFFEALQAVHQRGEVHITARELRATICYVFFGLYHCHDLHENPDLKPGHFYDRAFDPISIGRQGKVLQELALIDPSLDVHPQIDRYLIGKGSRVHSIPAYPDLSLRSSRRLAFFEWHDEEIAKIAPDDGYFGLAQGVHYKRFREVPIMKDHEREQLCQDLCAGIAHLEALPAIAFRHSTGIPLKITPRTPTESAFWAIKPFSRFTLRPLIKPLVQGIENLHTHLILSYHYTDGTEENLILGAELFQILLELKEGIQLTDKASEDIFVNLSIFTNRLAQENSRELYAWTPQEEGSVFKVDIVIKSDAQVIRCLPVSEGTES